MTPCNDGSHRRWSNTAVTREVDHHRVRWRFGLLLGVLAALAPAAVYVFQQNECLRLSYEAQDLRTEVDRLLEQERRLRVRRAALESLEAIEDWALRRNGMVNPETHQTVVVRQAVPQRVDFVARGLSNADRPR